VLAALALDCNNDICLVFPLYVFLDRYPLAQSFRDVDVQVVVGIAVSAVSQPARDFTICSQRCIAYKPPTALMITGRVQSCAMFNICAKPAQCQ
jgi:hypothetical protein